MVAFAALVCAIGIHCSDSQALKKDVQRWGPRFQMSGWRIDARFASRADLSRLCGGECEGASAWEPGRRGIILVASGQSHKEIERTVIHEMLHCVTGNLDEESAVEMITRAVR